SQYRSVVFYSTQEEKETIEQVIAFLEVSGVFDRPVVTQLLMLEDFYPAEEYHQSYYRKHGVSVC
ncbi:MAG TPA: peptide-methionine (S)-S-oxide reductase, partial [Anaerolineaceae bacterium]|nr:peptide-methionine (S)-S-oxide reductase [Anaerolineaceae bacterium]